MFDSILLPGSRIQTGKLSEFMTTSCFAHLSFLDGKGSRGMSHRDEELRDDDDECDVDGYVHELRCDDGKERHRLMERQQKNVTIHVLNKHGSKRFLRTYQIQQFIHFRCMTD